MAKLTRMEDGLAPPRMRGRPSPGVAAQIDQEILHAARELFLSHGFGGTSMAMVTQAAGVSKTTLYARYASKTDLFRATVRLTVERIANQTLNTAESRTYDLADGLIAYGREALRIGLAPLWSSYERLIYRESHLFPELTQSIAERTEVAVRTVSRFITDCAERSGEPLRDPDSVALAYVMAIRGFYTAAVVRGDAPGEEQVALYIGNLVRVLMANRAEW